MGWCRSSTSRSCSTACWRWLGSSPARATPRWASSTSAAQELERFLTRGIDADDPPRDRRPAARPRRARRPHQRSAAAAPADVGDHPRSYGFPLGPPADAQLPGRADPDPRPGLRQPLPDREAGGDFDASDEEALVVLADWAAIAIENARLYRGVAGRRDELERAVAASRRRPRSRGRSAARPTSSASSS